MVVFSVVLNVQVIPWLTWSKGRRQCVREPRSSPISSMPCCRSVRHSFLCSPKRQLNSSTMIPKFVYVNQVVKFRAEFPAWRLDFDGGK